MGRQYRSCRNQPLQSGMPGEHIQRIGIYHHPNFTGTTPLQQTLQRFHRPGILSLSASDTHCRITCHVGRQFRKTVGRIQTDHGRRKIRFDRKTFAFRQMHRHQSATRTQSGSCGKHGRPRHSPRTADQQGMPIHAFMGIFRPRLHQRPDFIPCNIPESPPGTLGKRFTDSRRKEHDFTLYHNSIIYCTTASAPFWHLDKSGGAWKPRRFYPKYTDC